MLVKLNLQSSVIVHKGQEVSPEGEVVGALPRTKTLGFRWSAFQNLLNSTAKIASDEWLAFNSEEPELADIAQKQQVWCLPVEDTNTERIPISTGIVRGSIPGYRERCSGIPQGVIPNDSEPVTCFIDISRRVLQWSVECKVDRRIHVPDYGDHETPHPDVIGEEAAIEDGLRELCPLLMEKYPDIQIGLIDCGNWRGTILKVVPTLPGPWRASHGLPTYRHPPRRTQSIKIPKDGNRYYHEHRDGRDWVINFDPDILKHRVHSGFMIKPSTHYGVAPGCITLFGDNPIEHTDYANQITAEEFRNVFEKGKGEVKKWHKTRRHNHRLDGCVGNMVGRMYLASQTAVRSSKGSIVQAARERHNARR
jgi:hypothetical protein